MLKKYISKFAMDIFPSVAATIIGAYIVNHYIATKPAANAPAAAVSSARPPAEAKPTPESARAGSNVPAQPAYVANLNAPCTHANYNTDKATINNTTADTPVVRQ